MAVGDKFVSQLPAATLPLSGTETIVGDQAGVTVIMPASAFGGTLIAASIVVSPKTLGIAVGTVAIAPLFPYLYSLDGTQIFGLTVTWLSSDITKATVDANGLVTAVGIGTCTITATCGTVSDSCTINITAAPFDVWYSARRDTGAGLGITGFSDAQTYLDVTGLIQPIAANTPRDNCWILGRKGLLIESAYTNDITWSEDLTNAAWVKTSCSISGSIKGPDGAASSGQGVLPIAGSTTLTAGTLQLSQNVPHGTLHHGLGWFVAPGLSTYFRITYVNGAGNAIHHVWFNLVTGKVGTQTSANGLIIPCANGFYLCLLQQGVLDAGAAQAKMVGAFVDADNSIVCTSDGTQPAGYLFGASSVQQSRPPISYTKTTNAGVTRNPDLYRIPYATTPAPKSWYVRGTDIFTSEQSSDVNAALLCIDGASSQGTKYTQLYISTTNKYILFNSALIAGNDSVTSLIISNTTVLGSRLEVRAYDSIVVGKMWVSHTVDAAVPEQVNAPAASTGAYSGAYGAGATSLFIGQQAGGTLVTQFLFEEFKVVGGVIFNQDVKTSRELGISQQPVWSITCSPAVLLLYVGDKTHSQESVVDVLGNVVTNRKVIWASSDSTVASVDQFGNITAVAVGYANIVAYVEGIAGYVRVQVKTYP